MKAEMIGMAARAHGEVLRARFGRATRAVACAYTVIALFACDGGSEPARAQDEARVVVQATNPAGVPLHPAERSRALSGRLPDRAEVEVVRWGRDRRWLEVRSADGRRGWISARYVAAPGVTAAPPDPWSSRQACLRVLGAGAARDPSRARLASWNLRWFPDGSSGGPSETPTDLEWVACLIATMRADAVAVQEIVLHARGREAIQRLLRHLDRLAGGSWRWVFDDCPRDGRQHVGWLIDGARARVLGARQLDRLNALGGCRGGLRPGSAVRLRFVTGLDLWAISMHLDSGRERRDHAHRLAGYRALVRAAARLGEDDGDVLALGDFNTMGCDGCAGGSDARAEVAGLDAAIAPSLVRVRPDTPCTELFRGDGALLDHAVVSRTMRELPRGARAEVHGPCARHRCRLPRGVHPPMLDHLSDHCPLVIELDARDLD